MHSDVKKRRSFVALLYAAGDLRRSAWITLPMIKYYLYEDGRPENGFEISKKDACRAQEAKSIFRVAADIEEKYDLILSNFYDFEMCLLEYSLKHTASHPYNENYFLKANKHIINLLTSTRIYLDHLAHLISESADSIFLDFDFKAIRSSQYDSLFGYRFMEALRNYVQHRDMPVNGISGNMVNDDRGIRHTTDVTIDTKRLLKDGKFKSTILEGIHARDISLTKCIRDQMEGLKNIQSAIRVQIEPYVSSAGEHVEWLFSKQNPKPERMFISPSEASEQMQRFVLTLYKFNTWQTLKKQNRCTCDIRRVSVNSEIIERNALR
jgi:hypothetical protein